MTDTQPEDRLAHEADLPELDPGLHARLLTATTAHIRHRRHRARLVQAAAVVIAFASGIAATLALQDSPGQQLANESANTSSTSTPTTATQTALDPETGLFDDPEALAFAYDAADDAERLRLLKEAGDHELNVNQDIRAALDYYRQWVVLADAATRQTYDETDTWLLASLKHTP